MQQAQRGLRASLLPDGKNAEGCESRQEKQRGSIHKPRLYTQNASCLTLICTTSMTRTLYERDVPKYKLGIRLGYLFSLFSTEGCLPMRTRGSVDWARLRGFLALSCAAVWEILYTRVGMLLALLRCIHTLAHTHTHTHTQSYWWWRFGVTRCCVVCGFILVE